MKTFATQDSVTMNDNCICITMYSARVTLSSYNAQTNDKTSSDRDMQNLKNRQNEDRTDENDAGLIG